MSSRSRFTHVIVLVWLAACGGTPREPVQIASPEPDNPIKRRLRAPDAGTTEPDLEYAPPPTLLSIDWTTVPLATDADAMAVWKTIAPTTEDWERKLDEIPVANGRPLAIAMLHAGNFTCMVPQAPVDCAPLVLDVDDPKPGDDMRAPCLRRLLALWSIGQLEDADVPLVMDSLRSIAAIPLPESQLVAAALQAVPENDHARRLELISIAYRTGQRDLANSQLGELDEAHQIEALRKHHVDGALEILSAKGHRANYLDAIKDERLATKARVEAITELVTEDIKLQADTKAALVIAANSKDCHVAASAARALAVRGDERFVPTRPRTSSPATMMRALCVLASYERLQDNDEDSLLVSFVPPKGLERVAISYDPLATVDTDGDGDPRTDRQVMLVERGDVVVPEVDDMIRSFRRCTGTTCATHDRDFRFGFTSINGALYLAKLELADRPPCPPRP